MKGEICSASAQRAKYIVSDLLMTAMAFMLFNICRYAIISWRMPSDFSLMEMAFAPKILLEDVIVPVGMLAIYAISGFYNRPFFKSRLSIFANTLCTALVGTAIIYMVILLNDVGMRRKDYLVILVLFGMLSLFVYAGRYIINRIFVSKLVNRSIISSTLVIGNSMTSRRVARQITSNDPAIPNTILGYVMLPGEKNVADGSKVWSMEDIERVCVEEKPDQIVIATEYHSDRRVMEILDDLITLDIPIRIAPDTLSYVTSNIRLGDIMGTPFVDLTSPRLSEFQRNVKRVLDVTVSVLALLLLSPLYAALAIAVKRSSPGPVFYSQYRLGKHQVPFRIYKFRTMINESEPTGPRLSSDDDPRITRTGRTLRKYRLDELPQFWNVLRGDMSLVGPRPERDYYVRKIMKDAPYYALIFQVRPGITSWGMVKYGYASTVSQMVERARYDLVYLNNMSIATDIKILTYTIRTVATGAGK